MVHSSTVQKNLESIGFSEKEAKIYCAALLRDSFTLAEIAKHSGVNRSTCYLVVLELVKKGYLTQLPDVAISRFMVVDPKTVGKKLQEQVSKTQSILLDAAEMRAKVEEMPKVELYKGVDDIKSIFDIIEKDKPKILYGILNTDFSEKYMGINFMREWVRRRKSSNISMKTLQKIEHDNGGEFLTSQHDLREVRFLPNKFNYLALFYVWKNKVGFISNKNEGIGFVVSSQEFADLAQELFNHLWDGAEKQ